MGSELPVTKGVPTEAGQILLPFRPLPVVLDHPPPSHPLSLLIINHKESPTWGEGHALSCEGEWAADFQDDLELVFFGPKLSWLLPV